MARTHNLETNGEFTVKTPTEFKSLSHFTDEQTVAHLKDMGIDEALVERAIQAAQKVFDDAGASVHVAQFAVEQVPQELSEKCRCGSRCTSWRCEPYQSCSTNANGGQTCVSGHRTVCAGMSCNPC